MARPKHSSSGKQQPTKNGTGAAGAAGSVEDATVGSSGSGTGAVQLSPPRAMKTKELDRTVRTEVPVALDVSAQGPALNWPVVGVGASAGGLRAFREILENLAPDTGMAFVLITHLSPDHKSLMSEILSKYTAMPVLSIETGVEPQPNHLYVLLPNENATLKGGKFHISERPISSRPNMPIDIFFRSLAADQKNYSIGIVLSGADSDGSAGSKAIKGEGGFSLVQSPETAEHPSMPRSSIMFDHVDLVLPPDEIGRELSRIASQFFSRRIHALEDGQLAAAGEEDDFAIILQMLRSVRGIEFRLYKPQTLRRRIGRRMVLRGLDTLMEYRRFVRDHPDELKALHEEVLINVTRFFRDQEFWDSLQKEILPALYKERTNKPIRIWCAGCSSGEEAYSMAIALTEYMSSEGLDVPVQIFGTDASERAIDMARAAIYPESLASELSPDRIRRYFVKVDRGFQVSKRVRDMCIFARQNLSNDPPFSHIDILTCRNVLIYFNQTLQRQVLATFHYALEPGGYIALGTSETLREDGEMFNPVDRKNRIYIKVGNSTSGSFHMSRYKGSDGAGSATRSGEPQNQWYDLDLQRAVDRIMLARFCPAGLIIDENLEVVQVRGKTAAFVELPNGSVTWSLLRILREEIVTQIRDRVQHAIKDNVAVTISPVHLSPGSGERDLEIDVLPLSETGASIRYFVIVFQVRYPTRGAPVVLPPSAPMSGDEKDALNTQLRVDLSTTRLHLQSMIQERDTHNQELVSANEEIQSANEELQSSNEELETTKEELQSLNEELQTVNEELQQRNLVLTQTGNDLTNLLNSVNFPLLMLTNELKIRQFTPPMQRLLNIRAADVGRSIQEIRLQLSIEDIEPILLDVLETLGTRELEVQDREGKWNLLRVRPYRTGENRIEGLVVVLVDIDQLRRSQQELVESRDFVTSVMESVPVPIVVLNDECGILTYNTAFRALAHTERQDLHGRSLPEIVKLNWGVEGFLDRLGELLIPEGSPTLEFEHRSTTSDRKILFIKGKGLSSGGKRIVLLLIEDITIRREAEELLASQRVALEQRVVTSDAELDVTREELRGLTAFLITVQEEERQRVSRELHDDICQRLSLMELMLNDGGEETIPGERERNISALREHIQALNTDVRQISHRLHPALLDDLGLATALKALVQEFGEREGMPATFVAQDVPDTKPQQATMALYRIAQEALRNVAKHAGKTHVKVALRGRGTTLRLEVVDLGVGFDKDSEIRSDGLGIISMQERTRLAQGTFSIESTLGMGTRIAVDVPVTVDA